MLARNASATGSLMPHNGRRGRRGQESEWPDCQARKDSPWLSTSQRRLAGLLLAARSGARGRAAQVLLSSLQERNGPPCVAGEMGTPKSSCSQAVTVAALVFSRQGLSLALCVPLQPLVAVAMVDEIADDGMPVFG